MNTSASTRSPSEPELWSIRGLIARHKLAAAGLAAAIAVMVGLIVVGMLGSTTDVSDATTCSEWGSANQNQQIAYARLYVREHGALRDGSTSPSNVIDAINVGCDEAFGDQVSDTTTVVQAISGNF